MENKSVRGSQHDAGLVLGAILIVAGVVYLLARFTELDISQYGWPMFIIVPGLAFIAIAVLIRSAAGLAVPGAIVTVVGVILAVQNTFGVWAAWTYAWALVFPGAIGLGTAIMGAVRRDAHQVETGLWSLLTGVAMFAVFGLFFEGVLHVSGVTIAPALGVALPVVVIGAGLALLVASIFLRRRA